MVPLLHMMLNCVFGGKGVGLMNMVMYVILAVFLCGLMIGRTPEYLGKKIEGKGNEAGCHLSDRASAPDSWLLCTGRCNAGRIGQYYKPRIPWADTGLVQYGSSAANNGSGFEGLADNTAFWNITAGLAMYFGRFPAIIIQLAIAGGILAKRRVNETIGTLRTDNVIFTLILVFIVYIFAALDVLPGTCPWTGRRTSDELVPVIELSLGGNFKCQKKRQQSTKFITRDILKELRNRSVSSLIPDICLKIR